MCLTPSRLRDGQLVACRLCRVCIDNRVNDLVGRALAEQATASGVLALTLTYKDDVTGAVVFNYADIQLFLANLRKKYAVRYIVAGEYGTEKGRVHWHIILFFYGKMPTFLAREQIRALPKGEHNYPIFPMEQVAIERRAFWHPWPHGIVYFQIPDYKGFRYLLKYALKAQKDGAVRQANYSKKPPLGALFFEKMADEHVARRIPIHSQIYSFKDVTDRKGNPKKFWLADASLKLFLKRFNEKWWETYNEPPPITEVLAERYLDPQAREEMQDQELAEGYLEDYAARNTPRKPWTGILGEKRPVPPVKTYNDDNQEGPMPTKIIRIEGEGPRYVVEYQKPFTKYSPGLIGLTDLERDHTSWTGDNESEEMLSARARVRPQIAKLAWEFGQEQRKLWNEQNERRELQRGA